mmetsp:Transcript_50830/g.119513  ORF Transcript_50830/g.119513 Transcript_50830/m.119513 type:complete len:216 (-) Transcript_50830:621-1268(-)|eukprot:1768324-Rhodomonas_salina.1
MCAAVSLSLRSGRRSVPGSGEAVGTPSARPTADSNDTFCNCRGADSPSHNVSILRMMCWPRLLPSAASASRSRRMLVSDLSGSRADASWKSASSSHTDPCSVSVCTRTNCTSSERATMPPVRRQPCSSIRKWCRWDSGQEHSSRRLSMWWYMSMYKSMRSAGPIAKLWLRQFSQASWVWNDGSVMRSGLRCSSAGIGWTNSISALKRTTQSYVKP